MGLFEVADIGVSKKMEYLFRNAIFLERKLISKGGFFIIEGRVPPFKISAGSFLENNKKVYKIEWIAIGNLSNVSRIANYMFSGKIGVSEEVYYIVLKHKEIT
jgi:hypothetical protein